MYLNEQTTTEPSQSTTTTHFSSPKLHPCVTSIVKWNSVWQIPLQRTLLGYCGAKNRDGAKLLLPDPCDILRKCLQDLGPVLRKHFAMMQAARRLATKHEIKWMEAKRSYTATDYRLACMDGRLKKVKAKEPNLKKEKRELSPAETARRAIARLGEQEKAKVLEELLK